MEIEEVEEQVVIRSPELFWEDRSLENPAQFARRPTSVLDHLNR